jgi:hypothetical protein
MRKSILTISILALAAGFASARGGGHGGSSGRSSFGGSAGRASGGSFGRVSGGSFGGGFTASGNFSRPLSRPLFASASRTSFGATRLTGFVGRSSSKSGYAFGTARRLTGAGTGTPGGGTGGGTGGTAAPSVTTEQGGWATPGSKILTAGQQPVYSTPTGGGTFSVNGGGFVAMNQAQAGDVGRAPSIAWGHPDTPPSTGSGGISGSGASSNGPAFDPSF